MELAAETQAERESQDIDQGDDLVPPCRGGDPAHFVAPEPPAPVPENEWLPAAPPLDEPMPVYQVDQATVDTIWTDAQALQPGSEMPLPAPLCQPRSLLQTQADDLLHADMITDAAKHGVRVGDG